MEITCKYIRSAIYGSHKTDLIVTRISAQQSADSFAVAKKHVIFVVDISASMMFDLQRVKTSLLTFNELLTKAAGGIRMTLIAFSTEAYLIWDSSSKITFRNAVLNLRVKSDTNMGAGVLMAYDHCQVNMANWIIVFTDGLSNAGPYQDHASFLALADTCPPNTCITTLGYGSFDPVTLTNLGPMTYIDSMEKIISVMGSLANEIMTTRAFNVRICIPSGIPTSAVVIGHPEGKIGCLHSGLTYIFGYVPISDTDEQVFSYTEISPDGLKFVQQTVTAKLGELTPDIVTAYYNSEVGRLLTRVYKSSFSELPGIVDQIRQWSDPEAAEAQQTVLRIIDEVSKHKNNDDSRVLKHCVSLQNDICKQSSHINSKMQTPSSKSMSQQAHYLSQAYQNLSI